MKLMDVREKLALKRQELIGLIEKGADVDGNYDVSVSTAEKCRALNTEINDLGVQAEMLVMAEKARSAQAQEERVIQRVPYGAGVAQHGEVKSFADAVFTEAKGYAPGVGFSVDCDVKTLMSTSAGLAPYAKPQPGVERLLGQKPLIADQIRVINIDQYAYPYFRQSTRTNSAAGIAEGAAAAESALAGTLVTAVAAKVGTNLPASEEILADVPEAREFLMEELGYMLRVKLDAYLLSGVVASNQPEGILNVSGILTRAQGSDSIHVALKKAMTDVDQYSDADVTAIIMHPSDFDTYYLAQASGSGEFLVTPTYLDGPIKRLLGVPVVTTTLTSAKTIVLGDFSKAVLAVRRGVRFDHADQHNDDFTKGIERWRATIRVAAAWRRPSAFNVLTLA